MIKTLLFSIATSLLACVVVAQEAQTAAVNFRQARVGINDTGARASSAGVEDLEEKKDTLEGEVRYAKAKLDAARKKLAVQTAANSPAEQLDALKQEVNEWEARLKEKQTQLEVVEGEVDRATGATSVGHNLDTQIILPGENLELFVREDKSFDGRYLVRRGGHIILPQVGRVTVAGKSIGAAEAIVEKALEASQLDKASVMIERIAGADLETGPLIYLNGEFKQPRPYRIPQGTAPSLVSVFLSSGGATDKGDLTRVRVMRMAGGKGVVEEVNLQRILDGAGLPSDVTLYDGDVVVIPAGGSNLVYLTGNVKRAGSYHLTPGEKLTAYGAVLQAGGFARFANLSKVHVLRSLPDGTKATLEVNIKDVQKGRRADIVLVAGDIVVVPEKWFSF